MSDGGFCHYCKRAQNQCECPDHLTTPDTAALVEKLKLAQQALSEAIKRQWSGGHALALSIPAQPERDTDLIIGEALRGAIAHLQSPPQGERPTCKTCPFFDAPCSAEEIKLCDYKGSIRIVPADGSGYCHLHPSAPKETR